MRIGVVIAGAMMVAGCGGPEPAGYPITPDQAYDRLIDSDLADLIVDKRCGIPVKAVSGGTRPKTIHWKIMSGGSEQLRITVDLTPVGADRTETAIAVTSPRHDGEAYDGSHTYIRPALEQPLRPELHEQIDALMEGRPYDGDAVPEPDDDLCDVQRAGSDSGSFRWSANDRGGETADEGERRRQEEARKGLGTVRPGQPDSQAGRPTQY